MYGHTCSKSMDQPCSTWSAEQGEKTFPCPRSRLRIWSRETAPAVPSRVSLLISILGLNLVHTYGIPPECRDGVHLFIETDIPQRVSPEFIGSRNCVPTAFTVESPPAEDQSTSRWFRMSAALADHHGPINMRLSFPHPLLVCSGHAESTGARIIYVED